MDADLVAEALQAAATADARYGGRHGRAPASAGVKAVRSLRRKLAVFLEDLPGDASVEELRQLLQP